MKKASAEKSSPWSWVEETGQSDNFYQDPRLAEMIARSDFRK